MLTFTERRRLALVAVITLIALPAILLMGNDSSKDDSATPTTTPASLIKTSDNSEPADPAFLPIPIDSIAPKIITVNIPAPPSGSIVKGTASFIRWPKTMGLRPCATPHALIGAIVTITNLNNGRSLKCNNVSIQSLTGGNIILIHTEVFLEIADLVDAPLPVTISF
ncbi:MAG: hypothetical protein WCG40_04010 [Actinomycetes bacterium]